jgi:hypothetical protein
MKVFISLDKYDRHHVEVFDYNDRLSIVKHLKSEKECWDRRGIEKKFPSKTDWMELSEKRWDEFIQRFLNIDNEEFYYKVREIHNTVVKPLQCV